MAQVPSWGCSQDIRRCSCHLKAGLGQEELLPRWLTHMTDKLVLAFWEDVLVSYHMDLSLELLVSPRAIDPGEQDRGQNVFYDLLWKLHIIVVQYFLSYTVTLIHCWRGLHKDLHTKKVRIIGSHLGGWLPPCSPIKKNTMSFCLSLCDVSDY